MFLRVSSNYSNLEQHFHMELLTLANSSSMVTHMWHNCNWLRLWVLPQLTSCLKVDKGSLSASRRRVYMPEMRKASCSSERSVLSAISLTDSLQSFPSNAFTVTVNKTVMQDPFKKWKTWWQWTPPIPTILLVQCADIFPDMKLSLQVTVKTSIWSSSTSQSLYEENFNILSLCILKLKTL